MRSRRPNPLARLTLGLSVTGTAMLLLPAIAFAGTAVVIDSVNAGSSHGLNYRTATFTSAGVGVIANAAAECPSTRTLTGGGGYVTGDPSEAWLTRDSPNDLLPLSTTKTWLVGAANSAGSTKDLTSFAICARHAGLKFVTKTKSGVPDGTVGTVSAKCPKGTSVTGGGDSNTSNQDRILTSAPFDSGDRGQRPDDGWRIRDRPVGSSADIRAHAICSSKLKLAYRRATTSVSSSSQTVAACPADSAVTGGGASLTGSADAFLNTSNPMDSVSEAGSVPDDGWQGYGAVLSGGSRTLTVRAICKV